MKEKTAEQFDEREAQRRFEKLVRSALNTPPKPLKSVPKKKPAPKRSGPSKTTRAI